MRYFHKDYHEGSVLEPFDRTTPTTTPLDAPSSALSDQLLLPLDVAPPTTTLPSDTSDILPPTDDPIDNSEVTPDTLGSQSAPPQRRTVPDAATDSTLPALPALSHPSQAAVTTPAATDIPADSAITPGSDPATTPLDRAAAEQPSPYPLTPPTAALSDTLSELSPQSVAPPTILTPPVTDTPNLTDTPLNLLPPDQATLPTVGLTPADSATDVLLPLEVQPVLRVESPVAPIGEVLPPVGWRGEDASVNAYWWYACGNPYGSEYDECARREAEANLQREAERQARRLSRELGDQLDADMAAVTAVLYAYARFGDFDDPSVYEKLTNFLFELYENPAARYAAAMMLAHLVTNETFHSPDFLNLVEHLSSNSLAATYGHYAFLTEVSAHHDPLIATLLQMASDFARFEADYLSFDVPWNLPDNFFTGLLGFTHGTRRDGTQGTRYSWLAVIDIALTVTGVGAGVVAARRSSLTATRVSTNVTMGLTAIRHGPMNPGPLPAGIANTFRSGSYTANTLGEATTLYRVHGGTAGSLGGYWTRTPPAGSLQARIDLALQPQWGNTATQVTTIRVPVGITIYEGVAAAQRGLVGGGSQVFIPRVDPSWVVP